MTRQMERRLERMEATQQHLTIVAMARRIGPEVGIEVDVLVVETEEILAECQQYGLTTLEGMIDHIAAQEGITREVLRWEMNALEARGQ